MESVRVSGWRLARAIGLVAAVLVIGQGQALAQIAPPKIGRFAVDLRGVVARYGPTDEQAAAIGYLDTDLPSRGWGVDAGAHVYPFRWWKITFGIGANVVASAAHHASVDGKGKPTGREADTRFRALASQVSLNFGSRNGWSYLSGGYGVSGFGISNRYYAAPDPLPSRRTVNFGAGARWTVRGRVALSMDLRFYRMAPPANPTGLPTDAQTTRMVFGTGLSFK